MTTLRVRRIPYTRLCTCASCSEVDRFYAKRFRPSAGRSTTGREVPPLPSSEGLERPADVRETTLVNGASASRQ